MDSPMPGILKRESARGPRLAKVEKDLARFQREHEDRCMNYLKPLIQQAFDAVRKRRPELECIVFGNGAFAVRGEPKGWGSCSSTGRWCRRRLPRYAERLYQLCYMANGYMEDIYPSKEEVQR